MKAAVLHGRDDCVTRMADTGAKGRRSFSKGKGCRYLGSDVPRVLGDAAHYYPIVLGHEFLEKLWK